MARRRPRAGDPTEDGWSDRLPPLGGGPTQWIADHPFAAAATFAVVVAVLGYFGLDFGRTGGQPFPSGSTGLVAGGGLAVVVFLAVWLRRRRG